MNFTHDIFLKNIAQTTGSPLLLDIESADGVYLYSPGGKAYMDLISGIAVSNIDIPRRLKPTRKYWVEGHFHAIHASTAKKCNETGTLLIFNEYKRVWAYA